MFNNTCNLYLFSLIPIVFYRPDGIVVPLGKPIDTKVQNPHGYTLNYNEFIVYDVKQIKMKYLVKVKFNFK